MNKKKLASMWLTFVAVLVAGLAVFLCGLFLYTMPISMLSILAIMIVGQITMWAYDNVDKHFAYRLLGIKQNKRKR